ncbi:hypothetical protein [Gelidibacter japonicus]|jgi:O-antigen ligase|uniref:hypothetical protein n=1 Tax=Gelidibacter japonicus TaxID=1962232 RepID=UPI003A9166F4
MKTKFIAHFCFLFPFALTVFNVQVFVALFVSHGLAQLIAYGNLGLLMVGVALVIKERGELSKTARLWIIYFLMYFSFATVGSAIHHNKAEILRAIIPFIYILAFYVYLSIPENRLLFSKIALICLVASSILAIYMYNINFDLEEGGVYIYKLDRAQGVFGDANNTALIAIVTYIFVYKLYKPTKPIFKIFKLLLLGLMFYTLVLTFSTTGFLVFIIAVVMLNHKFFTGLRLVFAGFMLPVFYLLLINLNTLTANIDLRGQQRDKVNNIVNVLSFNTDKVDDSGRSYLVTKLLNNYVYVNPIIGNGIEFGMSQRAHNTVVSVWADAGIFTLIFFLFMLGSYFMRAISRPPDVRFFVIPILITLYVFMLSLQSVINQPCIMALFVYLAYVIDEKDKIEI